MSKNKNFHSVEFFRKVRDEHAALLSGTSREEIIAFFCSQKAPNKSLQPVAQSAARFTRTALGGG